MTPAADPSSPRAPARSRREPGTRAHARGSRWPLLALVVALLVGLVAPVAPSAGAAPAPPRLSAPAAAVLDASSGRVLHAVNGGQRRLIASTTKMMTALVVADRLPLDRVCVAPPYVASPLETQIGLRAGERMTVRDLLRALLLASGNDAAEALAVCAAGSRGAFIRQMNAKARALRLRNTHFATPVGLDAPGNYSTAADLARLGIALRRHRFLARTVDLRSAELRSGAHRRTVVNRNGLVQRVPWVDGVKTGHTRAAGYLLVASGTRGRRSVVAAVLGAPSEHAREQDALALLRWAFAAHRIAWPVRAGAAYAHAKVKHRGDERVALVATRDVRRLIPRDRRVRLQVTAPTELEGPLPRHAVVGRITVRAGRDVLARVPLVTRAAVPEAGFVARAIDTFDRPGSLIAVVAIAGGVALLVLRGRRRGRRRQGRADMEAA